MSYGWINHKEQLEFTSIRTAYFFIFRSVNLPIFFTTTSSRIQLYSLRPPTRHSSSRLYPYQKNYRPDKITYRNVPRQKIFAIFRVLRYC